VELYDAFSFYRVIKPDRFFCPESSRAAALLFTCLTTSVYNEYSVGYFKPSNTSINPVCTARRCLRQPGINFASDIYN